jgi:DNA-binding Xre family transcriptional regulator
MLRLNIARLLRQRGKQPPLTYLIAHGFTRDEARSIMNPNLSMLRLSMMTRLCLLFNCQPNDLFGYDGKVRCHLDALNEVITVYTDDLLEGLNTEQIAELARMAQGMKKGK